MTRRATRNIGIMLVLALLLVLVSVVTSFGATASGIGYVNSRSGAYVRKSATTSSAKVALLKDNTKLTISKEAFVSKTSTAAKNKWLYVTTGGKTGYIRSDLVDGISYSAVTGVTTDALNYRVGPGTSMKLCGTLKKGTKVSVYMTATPYGSSTPWYKIKVGSSYYYACASWISISNSIIEKPTSGSSTGSSTGTPANTGGKTDTSGTNGNTGSSGSSGNTGSTDSQAGTATSQTQDFEAYMIAQGFPESYKDGLRKLHAAHPNWVFIAKNTGVDWNTAVSRESANGVSLVESVQPLAWRATDANSFKAGSGRTIYKTAGGGESAGTLSNQDSFTILDEVWKGTTQWTHITTQSGITGYISGALTSQAYASEISGALSDDYVNIRKGAGTSNAVVNTLRKGAKITIVLQSKDSSGNTWYKIKYNNGYAYIISTYVKVDTKAPTTITETKTSLSDKYPRATANSAVACRVFPDTGFKTIGNISSGTEVTVIGALTDKNGNSWLKIYYNGSAVYVQASYMTTTSDPTGIETPKEIVGRTTEALNYRTGAGTSYSRLGTFSKGKDITITGATLVNNVAWYHVSYGNTTVFVSGDYVSTTAETAPEDAKPVVTTETKTIDAGAGVDQLKGTGSIKEGSYIPKDGSTWFNANSQAVAYFMDPRNFLNEDRVYMFEDLSYHGEYQTQAVVNKILAGTALEKNGFLASWFTGAGAKYGMSPVALAARARQETGGGSIAITGYVYNGKTVYNPYNIGATSSSNPVMNGIKYAYNQGWYTKQESVYGGANFLVSGYINRGQNSLYFQRFNVANGTSSVATHQYMTNLLAPYSESYSVKTTYSSYGITNEALTFIVPIYNNMPSSTALPN